MAQFDRQFRIPVECLIGNIDIIIDLQDAPNGGLIERVMTTTNIGATRLPVQSGRGYVSGAASVGVADEPAMGATAHAAAASEYMTTTPTIRAARHYGAKLFITVEHGGSGVWLRRVLLTARSEEEFAAETAGAAGCSGWPRAIAIDLAVEQKTHTLERRTSSRYHLRNKHVRQISVISFCKTHFLNNQDN